MIVRLNLEEKNYATKGSLSKTITNIIPSSLVPGEFEIGESIFAITCQ
jgi:hypothetical protein